MSSEGVLVYFVLIQYLLSNQNTFFDHGFLIEWPVFIVFPLLIQLLPLGRFLVQDDMYGHFGLCFTQLVNKSSSWFYQNLRELILQFLLKIIIFSTVENCLSFTFSLVNMIPEETLKFSSKFGLQIINPVNWFNFPAFDQRKHKNFTPFQLSLDEKQIKLRIFSFVFVYNLVTFFLKFINICFLYFAYHKIFLGFLRLLILDFFNFR